MVNNISETPSLFHSTNIGGLLDGNSYTFYIRCVDTYNNTNTDDYLIIQNCTVLDGIDTNFGIYLGNVSNVNVRNNRLQNNYYGLSVYGSDNNNFSENQLNNNACGIDISYSSNNTLSWNNASYNNVHGISIYSSCNYNVISWNNASYNGNDGISLTSSSNNNTLSENTASYNLGWYGISLLSSSNRSTNAAG